MPTGKIKFINLEKKFGNITTEDGGKLHFKLKVVRKPTRWEELHEGMEVEFEVTQGEKGPTASWVAPVGVEAKSAKPRQPAPRKQDRKDKVATVAANGYRFLNPYNFVRFLSPAGTAKRAGNALGPIGEKLLARGVKGGTQTVGSSTVQRLLDQCPPPPHDRYVGFTGKITCTLTTETPLFISDAEKIEKQPCENGDEHKTYRFFQHEADNHRYILPASSLRGMIRNVFEAATNSCMAIFDYERRLQFRAETKFANNIKKSVGVVRALAKEASADEPERPGEIILCKTAEVPAYYGDGRDVLKKKSDGSEWLSGDRAIARVEYRGKRIRVLALFEPDSEPAKKIDEYASDDEPEYVEGWLKITGMSEGTLKKNEIFVFDARYNEKEQIIRFDFAAQKAYNEVLQTQLELEGLPEKPRPAKLKRGDLVYVFVRAGSLHRVQIPRLPYANKIADLLDNHACNKYDALCPACRTFGWVHRPAENEASKSGKEIAYAGRLRFSHGRLQHQAKTIGQEIPLAILSSPKPTTTSFYLFKPNEKRKPDFGATYDTSGAKLRGRKFYRHHGNKLNAQEYTRPDGKKDGQNRTVKEVLERDNNFTFTIDFTNLAPVELGALLWALEMKYQDAAGQEQRLFHRLGFAKPLGFGSVTINIDQLEVLSPQKRYGSLDQRGWSPITRDDWNEKYIAPFQAAMAARYGEEFYSLENIKDLKALLSEPKQCDHIHYPRPPYKDAPDKDATKPDPAGKQFEWFVGNKKRNARNFNFNAFPLSLAVEDTQGFELIDGDGNVYSGN